MAGKTKAASAVRAKPSAHALDLSHIGDLSELLSTPKQTAATGPLMLALSLIDEDPDQPRKADNPGFTHESLSELAETIRGRGVKSPISVRESPAEQGRYIINHGARRYRASKLAGNTEIPAFIDNDYNEADQVVENLQRDGLSAREIADFIGRELARGRLKKQIASDIGKSPSFVAQHAALLDLPGPVADAFASERVRDVTIINELVTVFKKHPSDVVEWLEDVEQEITRGSVKLFREFLEEREEGRAVVQDQSDPPDVGHSSVAHASTNIGSQQSRPTARPIAGGKAQTRSPRISGGSLAVLVSHDGEGARLVLDRMPTKDGSAWIQSKDGIEMEVAIVDIVLVGLSDVR